MQNYLELVVGGEVKRCYSIWLEISFKNYTKEEGGLNYGK
jgi:hypothetical protein